MAIKSYSGAAGVEAGVPNTKLRAEQMKSEDGFTSLAVDLEALRGQVKDIIGAADYKEEITGEYAKVQIVDLAAHIDASGATELIVKQDAAMSGSVQMLGTLNVDGEATLASAIVEDLTASRLMASDAGKGLVSADLSAWVAGTANQVAVADDADGSITLSLPQDIDTAASVEFGDVTVGSLVEGRVVYAGVDGALVDSSEMTFGAGGLTLVKDLSARSGSFSGDLTVSGDFRVNGALTYVDTQNLLVKDAKIVISSGSVVDGAGIYLGNDDAGENIRWDVAGDKWIASDKFAADTMQALDLSSAIVWADASGNLVEISAADLGGAIKARLVEGTGVHISEAAGDITIAIGQEVETTSSVTFAAVTGSNLTASRLMASDASKAMVSADLADWVTGTVNQIDVTGAAGAITLSLPQDIHTGATPEFAQLFLDGSDAYVDGGAGYLELGFLGGSIPVAQSGSVALSGFTASSIIGALNELKSVASASSKKATYEVAGSSVAAQADVKASLSADFISELNGDNGLVFVNGQMMLSGALGAKDYTIDGGVLKFSFGLSVGDVVVVQKA
jgi:hypothetical protein